MNDQEDKSTSEIVGEFAKSLKDNLAAKGIDVSKEEPLNDAEVKTLSESIDELTKALDSDEYKALSKTMVESSFLVTTNLMDIANKYLTDDAKAGLAKQSKQIVEVIDLATEKVTECLFLGVHVRNDKLEAGVKKIAEQINLLAAGGYIHSALSPIISVQLAKKAGNHLTSAVVAYVHVPADNASLAKSLLDTVMTGDGDEIPLHPLKIELPPGEFFAFERISIARNMIEGIDGTSDDAVKELTDMYLAILPKGTELVSVERCAIDSLSVPLEIRFRSPVLDRVKEVKLDYVRGAGVNSGKLEQGNVLLGIQYLDENGKDLYESARRPV